MLSLLAILAAALDAPPAQPFTVREFSAASNVFAQLSQAELVFIGIIVERDAGSAAVRVIPKKALRGELPSEALVVSDQLTTFFAGSPAPLTVQPLEVGSEDVFAGRDGAFVPASRMYMGLVETTLSERLSHFALVQRISSSDQRAASLVALEALRARDRTAAAIVFSAIATDSRRFDLAVVGEEYLGFFSYHGAVDHGFLILQFEGFLRRARANVPSVVFERMRTKVDQARRSSGRGR